MPVPTKGASGRNRGTAWRCMLAPIRARLASSCSRKGISAVATLTVCFGETSMYWTFSGEADMNSCFQRTSTRSSINSPRWLRREFAWAT